MLGERARLSFNIFRESFDLRFVVDLIERTGIGSYVRLGLACPIVGVDNSYVPTAAMPSLGRQLVEQFRYLEANDVLVTFDCGFPFCMFEEQDLGLLTLVSKRGFESACGSIIDVGPDLSAWPCFPLSSVINVDLHEFENSRELGAFFSRLLAPFRRLGTTDECLSCRLFLRQQCCGGCAARTIRGIEESSDPQVADKLRRLGHNCRAGIPVSGDTDGVATT
jgi:hypothetical protein